MTLYTRKGDKGDTSAFNCKQRFSKNSELMEALGSLDEVNSFLGICKIKAVDFKFEINNQSIAEIIENVQNNLFIIQANIVGADKKITQKKIDEIEKIIDAIEKELPPIKSFFLPGGSKIGAYFDYARAVSRRVERQIVALSETQKIDPVRSLTHLYNSNTNIKTSNGVDEEILAYLNRLSSLLYAMARFMNFKLKIKEIPPLY